MSTGRLTWLATQWNSGEWVDGPPALPRFAARYGEKASTIIARVATFKAELESQPSGPDLRESLKRIAAHGRGALQDRHGDMAQWGSTGTELWLSVASDRDFGTVHFDRLPDEGLKRCALRALDLLPTKGGAPSTDRFSVPLVRELASLWWTDLRHSELKRLRKLEHRRYPAIPLGTGKPTESEKSQLQEEERKMLRRALRACGIRGLTDSNIDRLLNDHG